MPSGETPMRADNTDLRTDVSQSEILASPIMGLDEVPGAGISPTFVADSHTQLDEVGQLLANAEVAVMSSAIDKLYEVEAECPKVQATLLGRIGVNLDKVEAACDRVRRKIVATQGRTAGQMYEYMGAARIPFPSMDEV